jgi:hypothetical protein
LSRQLQSGHRRDEHRGLFEQVTLNRGILKIGPGNRHRDV